MNWYWVLVKAKYGVKTNHHRFQAESDDDALKKAKEWCREYIGYHDSLVVAKEIFANT